jgi:hypothetical protein
MRVQLGLLRVEVVLKELALIQTEQDHRTYISQNNTTGQQLNRALESHVSLPGTALSTCAHARQRMHSRCRLKDAVKVLPLRELRAAMSRIRHMFCC